MLSEERLAEIRQWLTWAPQTAALTESHLLKRSLEYVSDLLGAVTELGYQRQDLIERVERLEEELPRVGSAPS